MGEALFTLEYTLSAGTTGPTSGSSIDGAAGREQEQQRLLQRPFNRHNIAVVAARGSKLITLNAQTTQDGWRELELPFRAIALSFSLL